MARATRPHVAKKAVRKAAKSTIDIALRVLVHPHGEGLPLPAYQTDGAAGFDLVAAVPSDRPFKLKRGMFALLPTGLSVEIPAGYEAQVRPRSGLAAKEGVTVLNAPGTIDSDYRGEVKVILINHGTKTVTITRGMRIAQMILAPVSRAVLVPTSVLTETMRSAGGFGSTGIVDAVPAKRKARATRSKVAIKAFPRRRVRPPRPGRS